ncbi:MAG: DNA polymerase III subunit alpha [Candidatus Eisenbacteria bacterium]|nr:DNA polymerase III subunit alpha [Candidatus Eisenbacteria bacterium]
MSTQHEFVHLHLHTEYSLLDGMCRVGPLMDAVLQRGMKAVAMTDHMSFFGVVPFVKEAQARGVKPIVGCEMEMLGLASTGSDRQAAEDRQRGDDRRTGAERQAAKECQPGKTAATRTHHIVLLAENNEGYANLLKLVSKALTREDGLRGCVTAEDVSSSHSGLIGISGCLQCEVATTFFQKGAKPAAKLISSYKELFGGENWFVGLSRHGANREEELNAFLVSQSSAQGVGLVATNNVYYLDRAEAPAHDVLLAIQTATHLGDPGRVKLGSDEYYLRSAAEMRDLFKDVPRAVELTSEIADRCRVSFAFGTPHLPSFDISPGQTARSYLKMKCEQGLRERFPEDRRAAARERLEHELNVVADKGLSGYFLVVWDLVRFAKSKRIPVGPGRGSSVGSLVSYCLGITEVDPIKHNLVFERFLTRERSGLPDIDVDLCHKRRDEVVQYLVNKYGPERVAHIATLDTLAPRSAVRDAGRALGIDDVVVDRVAGAIPGGSIETIEDALRESVPLSRMYDTDDRARRLMDSARAIQGLPRHASVHAGGVLITDAPLTRYVALQRLHSGETIAQTTKDPIEELGLLKIDLLGLRFLTALHDAADLVEKSSGARFEVSSIPLDDAEAYELIASGDTHGVFQLESAGMQDLLRKLRPERFEDVAVAISLFRPGPIGGGLMDKYVARRHGREDAAYPHPLLEPVLRETYGVVLYQEQVMEIAGVLADFTMEEADVLRSAITGRKPGELAAMRHRFISGAIEKGVEMETAEKVFELLLHFGGFGYNKSHSVAFALTTYRCAYMMARHTGEYVTALLNNNFGFVERMRNYMAVARERGVEFLPPDANKGGAEFTLEDGAIRAGLAVVKHVGEASARAVVAERDAGGEFGSFSDFCARTRDTLNRQAVESLIKAGALDFTGLKRSQMAAVLNQVLKAATDEAEGISVADSGQIELGLRMKRRTDDFFEMPDMDEWPQEQLREREWEATDLFISEHPLRDRASLFRQMGILSVEQALFCGEGDRVSVAGLLSEYRRVRAKNGKPMAFLTVRDETGVIEVVVFPTVFEKLAKAEHGKGKLPTLSLTRDEPIVVTGKIQVKENVNLICDNLEPLEAVQERFYATGVLELSLRKGFRSFSKLKNALLSALGNSEVRVEWVPPDLPVTEEMRAEVESLKRHRVQLSDELLADVEKLVGKGNVRLLQAGLPREGEARPPDGRPAEKREKSPTAEHGDEKPGA